MAVQFKVPKSPAKSIYEIDAFKGVDFSNSPANIDDTKSPNAINMIRDVPDKVRKRMGYEVLKHYGANLLNNMASTTDIFTVNKDKSVKISGSGAYDLYLSNTAFTLKAGKKYILKGVEKNGSTERIGIYIEWSHGTIDVVGSITNLGAEEFEVEEDIQVSARITTRAGFSYNETIYPQLYEVGKESPTYVPYISGSTNINGVHYRRGDTSEFYHIGDKILKDNVVLYSGANDAISHAWEFDTNLYIVDGKKMLQYDGDTGVLQPVENDAYVPTITIAKDPKGGGTQYESINLLSRTFIETFLGTQSDTNYYLTFGDLTADEVKVWIMDAQGDFQPMTEGSGFSVDRQNGIVQFDNPPGESYLTGEDNVKIEATRVDSNGYRDRINKCTFGTRFGVNGAFDRLFLSGNPDWPNADWYSQQWDCTYFPDMGYSRLGSSKSAIVGYSIISNYLAAHKDEMEQDLSIVLREGDLVDNEPSFKIINTLQGAGAIATNSFAYLCTEPLFLTRSGLYAVTAQDITGEKYAQSRSFYLNGKLTQEDFTDLQNSFACIFNDMYLLSVDHDRLYILDGLQPIRTDKSEPYATRQYVGFYCDNLPINYMWEKENRLFFGTQEGQICRFFNDKESQESYNDNGQAICCQWETPDIDGKLFYKNKSLRYIAIRVGAAIATSVELWIMDRGIWKFVKKDNSFGRYFSFEHLIFSKVAFSGNKTQKISRTKVRLKRVDKYRLRFVNNELNEPFALYNIANEYTENGNYKG